MSFWTHLICTECWNKEHPDKQHVSASTEEVGDCCFCGGPVTELIYVRQHGGTLPCKGECDS